MPTPFAALESLVNAVTLAKLANATAVIDGVQVDGVFDNGYGQTQFGMGMATRNPRFTLPTAAVPANPVGTVVGIGSESYSISEHEPDGTGMTVLILELAA